MGLLNTANGVYLGATPADAVYLGTEKVWSSGPPPDPYVEDGSFSGFDYLRQNPFTDIDWYGWYGDGSGPDPETTGVWDRNRDAFVITIPRTFVSDDMLQLGDFASARWPSTDIAHPLPDPDPASHPMVRVESRWQSTIPGGQLDMGYADVAWSSGLVADWGYWGMYTGLSADVPNPNSGPPPVGYWYLFIWTGPGVTIRAQEIEITGLRTAFLKPNPEAEG